MLVTLTRHPPPPVPGGGGGQRGQGTTRPLLLGHPDLGVSARLRPSRATHLLLHCVELPCTHVNPHLRPQLSGRRLWSRTQRRVRAPQPQHPRVTRGGVAVQVGGNQVPEAGSGSPHTGSGRPQGHSASLHVYRAPNFQTKNSSVGKEISEAETLDRLDQTSLQNNRSRSGRLPSPHRRSLLTQWFGSGAHGPSSPWLAEGSHLVSSVSLMVSPRVIRDSPFDPRNLCLLSGLFSHWKPHCPVLPCLYFKCWYFVYYGLLFFCIAFSF